MVGKNNIGLERKAKYLEQGLKKKNWTLKDGKCDTFFSVLFDWYKQNCFSRTGDA